MNAVTKSNPAVEIRIDAPPPRAKPYYRTRSSSFRAARRGLGYARIELPERVSKEIGWQGLRLASEHVLMGAFG